jgi:hypothetical protein
LAHGSFPMRVNKWLHEQANYNYDNNNILQSHIHNTYIIYYNNNNVIP